MARATIGQKILRFLSICLEHRYTRASLLALFALFLFGSLVSFNPDDPSWFFYTTTPGPFRNWFGILGVHMAAMLYCLLGSSCLLSIPYLMWNFIGLIRFNARQQTWDRHIGWVLLLFSLTTVCAFFVVEPFTQLLPGGVVGSWMHGMICAYFSPLLEVLLLITLSMVSIILVSRLFFVHLLYRLFYVLRIYASKELLWLPLGRSCRRIAIYCWYPIDWCWSFSMRLWRGDDLADERIVDFESLVQRMIYQYDDAYWKGEVPGEPLELSKQEQVPLKAKHEQSKKQPAAVYRKPSSSLLPYNKPQSEVDQTREQKSFATVLQDKLSRFGIQGTVVSIKTGPFLTLIEYEPHIDSKISKIIALEDDLALALEAMSIRIIAPIPGRKAVGFEIANKQREPVLLAELIGKSSFRRFAGSLPLILGKDTMGQDVVVDLVSMPHLLVAGSTGSGKSVALNAMLLSLLYWCTPEQLKLILIDPKRLEFASYADVPHLLFPIVTDPQQAVQVLKWVVTTMEDRYESMAGCGVRNLFDYHERQKEDPALEPMPFVVVMIDELSDLMMTAGKEVEIAIARLAQMARAAGIHLIVATQRPSVDVITGLIKVNFPSRISFRVTSKADSRTILDCTGAEKLLGRGDMLFLHGGGHLQRIHGAYVCSKEVEAVVAHVRAQQQVSYTPIHQLAPRSDEGVGQEDQQLYQQVVAFVHTRDEISISLLQRQFRIGYNRSARIIDQLETQGHILPNDGGKMRKVIR